MAIIIVVVPTTHGGRKSASLHVRVLQPWAWSCSFKAAGILSLEQYAMLRLFRLVKSPNPSESGELDKRVKCWEHLLGVTPCCNSPS